MIVSSNSLDPRTSAVHGARRGNNRMAERRDLLLGILRSARGKALSVDEVMQRGSIDVGAAPHIRGELRAMVKEGAIEAEGKRFRMKQAAPSPPKPKEAPPKAVESVSAALTPFLPPRPVAGS